MHGEHEEIQCVCYGCGQGHNLTLHIYQGESEDDDVHILIACDPCFKTMDKLPWEIIEVDFIPDSEDVCKFCGNVCPSVCEHGVCMSCGCKKYCHLD